jgi:hypothetical protein
MRKLVAVLALGVLLMSGLPAQAGPVPTPRVDREAWASWLLPTSKPHVFKWFGFQVETRDSLESASAMVFVVRGRCEIFKRGSSCSGMGSGTSLKEGEFEMAPDASSASLKMTRRGKRYAASWTSEPQDTGFYFLEEMCMSTEGSSGQGAGVGTFRTSSVTGVYAGRTMTRSRAANRGPTNYLQSGAAVTQCEYMRLTPQSDGTVRATWTSPRA